ncbi:MAG TPA: HAMP domain-containing sensor histidine kinase [Elusimicrobiota bacterium]|nr:HAMP domain-containing sensor histidine kinase [Elusimicrobiota bacterium]
MESKLLAALAGLALGAAAGYWLGRRRRGPASVSMQGVPDEERLVWLQRLSTVGQMMSGVVHEVRTPLNTVILTIEHAQRVLERGGDPREQFQTVTREADRAVEILSDVLDFAKPSPLELKPVALAPLVKAALDPIWVRFDERTVDVWLELPGDLRVLASARHIHQVLTILLINALDAMPFGGRLDVRAERAGAQARLILTDTGVGIEPQVLKRLFEPFATGRPESGGTGLGLNVARWIMHKHGGDVSISSGGIGKGTTVVLLLKAADDAEKC